MIGSVWYAIISISVGENGVIDAKRIKIMLSLEKLHLKQLLSQKEVPPLNSTLNPLWISDSSYYQILLFYFIFIIFSFKFEYLQPINQSYLINVIFSIFTYINHKNLYYN